MDGLTVLGLAAGAITTISFIPQVVKTWKTKSTKDISAGMFLMLSVGLVLWIIYGIYIQSLPVILTNVLTLVLVSLMLVLKRCYR
ncbi:MAG: SemiSWEET transporter [Deltaproteobacteria bacterium]|nr:SemiSWEET transporter [Deltaproteobacteria bacterium]